MFKSHDTSVKDKAKLRIGLLLNNFDVPAWIYTTIRKIAQGDYAEIELVILRDSEEPSGSGPSRRHAGGLGRALFGLFARFEDRLIRITPDAFRPMEAIVLLEGVPVYSVRPLLEKGCEVLTDEDVEKIRAKDLDVLVNLGFGRLQGEILRGAKFGVWIYQHSDVATRIDELAGFWEMKDSSPVLFSSLCLHSEDSRRAFPLFQSCSHAHRTSLKRTRNAHFWKSSSFVPRKLEELHRDGPEVFFRKLDDRSRNSELPAAQKRVYPTAFEMFQFAVRKGLLFAGQVVKDYFSDTRWILMHGTSTEFSSFRKMIPPQDRYWADPFVISRSDGHYIFIEEFDYHRQKGHISVIVLDDQGRYSAPEKIVDRPYHLSYPFVFEVDGRFYLIPESAEKRTIEVYECVDFPRRWEFKMNLMEDLIAYDSTLFRHNGKWWLFTTIVEVEGGPDTDELFVFSAEDLFTSNWIPHPLNPVISDVRRGRSAGRVFLNDGKLFRLSQDGSRRYGYAFSLNEILVLNDSQYQEKTVRSVLPDWDRSIQASHTMSHSGNLTVIDALLGRKKFFGRIAQGDSVCF